MPNKPTIIFFDIETSPVENLRFQKDHSPYISADSIMHDSYMISAAWKVAGEKQVHVIKSPKVWDDFKAVADLRKALVKADAICGHNIDKFDIKYLNARLMYHGLPPLPLIPTIDTYKEVKRVASFTSHKLDYLAQILLGDKKKHVSFDLWKQVVLGSKKALDTMVSYNKHDVVLTEKLYNHIRPYMKNHVHMGVMMGKDRRISCGKCGSTNVKRNGIRVTAAGLKKQEVQCLQCGSYHRIPLVNI